LNKSHHEDKNVGHSDTETSGFDEQETALNKDCFMDFIVYGEPYIPPLMLPSTFGV